jgi:hypothetical protein
VQPPLWSDAAQAAKASGQSLADYFAVVKRCSIREADGLGQPLGRLTDAENARLRIADSLLLDREIADVSAGPELVVRGKCPTVGCEMPYAAPINWRFENFFGSSFQPLLSRSSGERKSSSSATTSQASATRSTAPAQASASGS